MANMVSAIRFRNPWTTMSSKTKITALALVALYGTVILAVILIGPSNIFQCACLNFENWQPEELLLTRLTPSSQTWSRSLNGSHYSRTDASW
jgi:hypothetical protein